MVWTAAVRRRPYTPNPSRGVTPQRAPCASGPRVSADDDVAVTGVTARVSDTGRYATGTSAPTREEARGRVSAAAADRRAPTVGIPVPWEDDQTADAGRVACSGKGGQAWRLPLARPAAHIGQLARSEPNASRGPAGARRLARHQDGDALRPPRSWSPRTLRRQQRPRENPRCRNGRDTKPDTRRCRT